MKTPLSISIPIALLLATAPLESRAATFFADYFTNSSTINSLTPVNPTTNSTSYEMTSSKSWVPTPAIGNGDLKFGIAATTAGSVEVQALFATNAVALTQPGDFIQLTVVFTNTAGLLTAANTLMGFGLYNSAQVKPVAGGLNGTAVNTINGNATGGVQGWQGYVAQVSYSGVNSRIMTRAAQTAGTDNRNQDLVTTGSGSSSYGNPGAANVSANTNTALVLVAGSTYTEVLTITLNDVNSLAITNALYSGPVATGTALAFFGGVATNTTYLTSGYDGLCIGWRETANVATTIDISSIVVSGSVTVISAPPDITSQPIPVVVPSGGSATFSVGAQGFNVTYQWRRNGTNLLNGGNISGATSDTLIISPASAADVASGAVNGYYVVVSGAGNFSTNSSKVSLTLGTARNLVWNGPGSDWDLNTSANFLDPVNPTAFNYGDSVTFPLGGSPSGVVLTGKYLSASSVTVDGNYAFTGTGSFAGPGKLICRDSTFLDLGNANTHSGGTLISNASASAYVYLRNYNALGTGPLTLAKPGLMEVITTGSASLGINGDVIVKDDFTIQFDGMGTFGGVLLGSLSGTAGKILTVNPNPSNVATNQRIRVYGTNTYDGDLVLNSALITLAPYHGSGTQTYNGVISGPGAINHRGNGITILNGQNTYSGGTTPTIVGGIGFGSDDDGSVGCIGSGPLLLAPETTGATGSGMVFASGGARTIANPIQNQNGTNNLTLVIGGNNNLTFTGPYTLNGNDLLGTPTSRTLQVTNTGLTTFSGVISDAGQGWGLIKTGNGILALSNTETYTGPTAVSNGTLRVNGSLATGAVTVVTNATLGGSGTINGPVTVQNGGILAPGNSIGTLNINNNLSLVGNLSIEVNTAAGNTSDKTDVSGTLANTGLGSVTVTNLGPALVAGNTFTLFNKAVTGGGTMTVTGAGVNWTNKLAINGTIEVLSTIPTTPTNITFSISGNALTLNWPASYLGWTLQSNSVSVAATNGWFPVPSSASVTQLVITVNPTKTNVFYRLVYP